MTRRLNPPPCPRGDHNGQARITLRDALGRRKDVMLGKFDSPDSHAEYPRIIVDWLANGQSLATKTPTTDITINELIERLWSQHIEPYYRRPDGSPTSEQDDFRLSIRTLRSP